MAHSILECNTWESRKEKQELLGKYVPKLELGNENKGRQLGNENKGRQLGNENKGRQLGNENKGRQLGNENKGRQRGFTSLMPFAGTFGLGMNQRT